MSDTVKITVVFNDEKSNIDIEEKKEQVLILTHDSSTTIMSTLLQNGLVEGSFCGERGICGRCKVQMLKGVEMPKAVERSLISPEELRQGYRLACLARPKDDCVIRLEPAEEREISIISDMIEVTQDNDQISQWKMQTENQKTDVSDHRKIADAMIAVDLGTTTIAMQLMEVDTGRVIDTYCEMNPQRRYGSDVLSRIQASCDGNRKILQQLVLGVLERGVDQFKNRPVRIGCMCIAGNTTMEHLFMGYDVLSLGRSPFTPVEIGLQEYHSDDWDFRVWITPGISTFVGGDIVAGLYALNMLPESDSHKDMLPESDGSKDVQRARLLIDLGTNGEMAITDGCRMIVTATAAGPAFEGGAGAEIVGSDMIANVAALLQRGILDETGLLKEPFFSEGISVGEPAVIVCNKDIRDLQMAKAAVRAGVEILWKKMGEPEIERVYLAGGFGYYLDVEAAFRIGLLPEFMHGKVSAAGNTSLAGAYRIGCDLLRNQTDGEILTQRLDSVITINLAQQEEFEELYVKNMELRRV